jgi:hypothetical protein
MTVQATVRWIPVGGADPSPCTQYPLVPRGSAKPLNAGENVFSFVAVHAAARSLQP